MKVPFGIDETLKEWSRMTQAERQYEVDQFRFNSKLCAEPHYEHLVTDYLDELDRIMKANTNDKLLMDTYKNGHLMQRIEESMKLHFVPYSDLQDIVYYLSDFCTTDQMRISLINLMQDMKHGTMGVNYAHVDFPHIKPFDYGRPLQRSSWTVYYPTGEAHDEPIHSDNPIYVNEMKY